jgi:predicted TIM-barrel fold metal-dependent hydrolase
MSADLSAMPVIDIDAHWTEPPDLWLSRAPAKLKERVPRIELDEEGHQRWVVDSDTILGPPGLSVIRPDGSKVTGLLSLETLEEQNTAMSDPKGRLKLMDSLGIHSQILYPNALGFAGGSIMELEDPELRAFCITGYNDAIGELQASGEGRLYPQAMLPFWDVDLSVRELKRCRKTLGLVGFTMTDSPQEWGLPCLNDPYWDPVWSTAQDLQLPVNFHIGSGGFGTSFAWDGYEPPRWLAVTSVALFLNNARCILNLIFSGLLDRYPDLKFVSVESGIGWLPFMLEACEYQLDENMGSGRCGLKLRPAEYFQRQIYASFWFEKNQVAHTIELLGEDNIMFETDVPHPTCLYPGVRQHLEDTLGGLEPRVQRKIMYETAAKLYQLPMPS